MSLKPILALTPGIVLPGLSPIFHGQSTDSAGTAASVSLDHVQPGLAIRAIPVGSGFSLRGISD